MTSDYLLNPSFELSAKDTPLAAPVKKENGNVDIYGWTLTGVNTSTANSEIVNKDIDNSSNYGTKVAPADGKYYLFARNGWLKNSQIKLTYGMKYLVDRERPYDKYPDRVHAYSHEGSPSFPSGHTATAFALATSLSVKYPKWYVIAPSALWACSVGVSRMNEGVHYPSDVLAGAAIGAGCAVVNIYVNKWLNKWLFGE